MDDPKTIVRFRETYGDGKLRQVLRYYSIGIPEKFWFDDFKIAEQLDLKALYEAGKGMCVIDSSSAKQHRVLAALMKNDVLIGFSGVYKDFFVLLGESMGYNAKVHPGRLIQQCSEFDVICISNIQYGKFYDESEEAFISFLIYLLNARTKKLVLLGLETSEIEKQYGKDLKQLIDENFITWVD